MSERDDDALRARWREHGDTVPGAACPAPDALWSAATGTGPAALREAVAAHAMRCGACAEEWRLARALGEGETAAVRQVTRRRATWRRALAAAAVLVVASVAVFVVTRGVPDGGPVLRAPVLEAPRALVAENAGLPRDAFRLAWTAGPAGTVYDVEIGTPALVILDRAHALARAEYTVPPKALQGLAAGAPVAWRVIATWPDGRTVASVTFLARVK